MTEQSTSTPHTALDKFYAGLRSLGIRRRTDDKWIAGVCSGVADRLGVDPVIVRAAMVLLVILGGIGVTVYLVAWALLPNDRDELAVERALRDGDGGAIVLVVITALALFGGSWWSMDSSWAFPWGLVISGVLIWWLVQRSRNHPGAGQRVSNQQTGPPFATGPSPAPVTFAAGPPPTFAAGPPPRFAAGQPPNASGPVVVKRPRRRSGGLLMALLAIGLALVSYGSLSWLGDKIGWAGDHTVIAMAGSLAALGLLLVVLGLAGWRAGFVGFLAVVLAITTLSSSAVPAGIHLGGPVGDKTWQPTSVTAEPNHQLGMGNGVLDLSLLLPKEGLSEARVPAYVGVGELVVRVPRDLTVKVVGHVGLGSILLPGDAGDGPGGTDVSRSVVIGDGPTEVVVDAGVGVGQLTVVKE